MNFNLTPQLSLKDPRETVVITMDATAMLAPGETLTGTPEVSIKATAGADSTPSLVLSGVVINSVPLTLLKGKAIAIGAAVQAVCSAGTFGSQYWIAITCQTSNPNKILVLKAALPMSSQ
ncbi:hypothetical protein BGLT_02279 [Caballeronia glathei]|nr:hypothetical protein [Caballeronia glathei]CDY79498.1 hypothetical protein BGLT_02279 [Caballeronia glathei]